MKREKESFSDVIKRITSSSTNLMDFAGIWNLSEDEKRIVKNRTKDLEDEFDAMFG